MGNQSSSENLTSSRDVRHIPRLSSSSSRFRRLYRSLNFSQHSFSSVDSDVPDSLLASPCSSVRLLSFRPSSSSFYGSTPPSSNASLKSSASAGVSSISSTNSVYKRSARGRSVQRCSGSGLASSPRRIPHASKMEELKTPYPVTTKEAIFLPQFPIRSATCTTNRIQEEQTLSAGKFGDVTRVRVAGKSEYFALKRIRKNFVVRFHTVQQVKDEAAIQREFCIHPFLVRAVDSWQTRSHLCILTEFVIGGDLSTFWYEHGKVFPEEVVRIWGLEIGLALDHLHSRGILYRDLKLANSLLDGHGHLKLADFGLAKMLADSSQRTKTICGTLNYMAPEILQEAEYEASADWWSFGIVLYALLVGHYPVEPAADHTEMCREVSRHRYIDCDKEDSPFSPAASHLLDRLLRKNPETRLQSLQVIKDQAFFCGVKLVNVYRKTVSPFQLLRKLWAHRYDTSVEHCEPP